MQVKTKYPSRRLQVWHISHRTTTTNEKLKKKVTELS